MLAGAPFDGADVAFAGRGDHVDGEDAAARCAQPEIEAHRQAVQRPGSRPGPEERLRVDAHAHVDGRTLTNVEIEPTTLDVRLHHESVAGASGECGAGGLSGAIHVVDVDLSHLAGAHVDGDDALMVGVRDQQAAVRQHVQTPGLVEALELAEGASQRYRP